MNQQRTLAVFLALALAAGLAPGVRAELLSYCDDTPDPITGNPLPYFDPALFSPGGYYGCYMTPDSSVNCTGVGLPTKPAYAVKFYPTSNPFIPATVSLFLRDANDFDLAIWDCGPSPGEPNNLLWSAAIDPAADPEFVAQSWYDIDVSSSGVQIYNASSTGFFVGIIQNGTGGLAAVGYDRSAPNNEPGAPSRSVNHLRATLSPPPTWFEWRSVGVPGTLTSDRGDLMIRVSDVPECLVVIFEPNQTLCVPDGIELHSAGCAGTVTWDSSDDDVATVSAAGLVTAVGAGTATITAHCPDGDGCQDSIQVAVVDFAITQANQELCHPDSLSLTSTGCSGSVLWFSTNPSAATVNSSTGLVETVGYGTTTIIATCSTGGCQDSITVSVVNFAIVQSALELCVPDQENLTTSGCPGTVSWLSSDPGVATVDPATGQVTAVGAGSAVITATCSTFGCQDTVNVTVVDFDLVEGDQTLCHPDSVSLNTTGCSGSVSWSSNSPSVATVHPTTGLVTSVGPGTALITATCSVFGCQDTVNVTVVGFAILQTDQTLCVEDSVTLTSSGCPGSVSWLSSDPSVASVGPTTGYVVAHGAGLAVITATCSIGGCQDTRNVEVVDFAIVESNQTLCLGDTVMLHGSGCPGSVSWLSSAPAVASVDPASGLVTAISAGSAVITATCSTGGCEDTISVQVVDFAIVEDDLALCHPASVILTSSGCPGQVSWLSSNPAAATVGAFTGEVESVGAGTAVITATCASGGCQDAITVTVVDFAIVQPDPVLCHAAGSPAGRLLTVTGCPGTVAWESDDPLVAEVGATTGLVTSVGAGTAVITATCSTGGCQDTVLVTVVEFSISDPGPIELYADPDCGATQHTLATTGCNAAVLFLSGNPTVAEVGQTNGKITAIGAGTTTITARCLQGDCLDTIQVEVDGASCEPPPIPALGPWGLAGLVALVTGLLVRRRRN